MKIAVITVGTGREVEKGIAYSINSSNPDEIHLLCSGESLTTCEKVKVLSKKSEDSFIIHVVNEINDIERLYEDYSQYIGNLIDQNAEDVDFVVDFTSGTKAMSSAIVAAAIERKVSTMSYVSGERDKNNGGRVISGSERVMSLQPKVIYAVRTVKQATHFFNIYQYEAAIAILDEISDYHKGEKGRELVKLAQAYNARDKFDFEGARKIFAEITEVKELNLVSKTEIQQAFKSVKLLASEAPFNLRGPELVRELWSNAKRRAQFGSYDDATARLYRLLELIGQVAFYEHFGYTNSEIPVDDKLPLRLRPKKASQETIKISLRQTFEYLQDEGVEVGVIWKENWKGIEKILSSRNYSILAHGLTAVTKEKYQQFSNQVEAFLPKDLKEVQFPNLKT
jgi:CRISPR-associated protein (TIGR02710 family)